MYLPENRIRSNVLCGTWEESVVEACLLLEKDNLVDSKYSQAIINTANEMGPYFIIAPEIMMAHARPEEGALGNGLSFISLANEVDCLGRPVRYVFGLSAVGGDEHVKMIEILSTVLDEDNIYDVLKNSPQTLKDLFE